jgi:hypothetical protein
MPFTPAHAAAALPFQRTRLITSALVIGTFAPDFEYFIRLSPGGGFGHGVVGALEFTLPVSLAVLWIFHTVVKAPLAGLLPVSVERRLTPYLGTFRFLGPRRLALIIASLLIGIATHLLWDSFTHSRTWLYHHWAFLHQVVRVPVLGPVLYFKLFQQGSTLVGLGILTAWLVRWYRTATPSAELRGRRFSLAQKVSILWCVSAVACLGAAVRILSDPEAQGGLKHWKVLLGYAVVTWIAVAWWMLVGYGLVFLTLDRVRRRTAGRGDLAGPALQAKERKFFRSG